MARNTKARGKIVRRLGVNVYGNDKYDRLLKKKPQKPGRERGQSNRRKDTDYGKQLMEKQKLRFSYGMSEKQFYNVFAKAKRVKGQTGTSMMIMLEQRLDNVVYRLGMANTRAQARQFVGHGHIRINGKVSNIPSMLVKRADKIMVKDSDASRKLIRATLARNKQSVPPWLSLFEDSLTGHIERVPFREDITTSVANEQMVVEYYSR